MITSNFTYSASFLILQNKPVSATKARNRECLPSPEFPLSVVPLHWTPILQHLNATVIENWMNVIIAEPKVRACEQSIEIRPVVL